MAQQKNVTDGESFDGFLVEYRLDSYGNDGLIAVAQTTEGAKRAAQNWCRDQNRGDEDLNWFEEHNGYLLSYTADGIELFITGYRFYERL